MKINKDTVLMDGNERIHPMGGECGVIVGKPEGWKLAPICGTECTHVCESCGQWMCDKHTYCITPRALVPEVEPVPTSIHFCTECVNNMRMNSSYYKENL